MALAAYKGQLEVVKDLAARKANLEAKDRLGRTPISLAAEAGQLEVVKDLAARNTSLLAHLSKRQLRFVLTPTSFFFVISMASNLIAFELRTCRSILGMKHYIHRPTPRTIS